MHDLAVVAVLDGPQDDHCEVAGLLLAVALLLDDAVEELTAVDALQHNVQVRVRVHEVVGLNYVPVVQVAQDLRLPADASLGGGLQAGQRNLLNRDVALI